MQNIRASGLSTTEGADDVAATRHITGNVIHVQLPNTSPLLAPKETDNTSLVSGFLSEFKGKKKNTN